MVKKNKKYRELNLEQAKLKSVLHENIRRYRTYRSTKSSKTKAPITLAELERQQKEINVIRKQLDKIPIVLIQSLKRTLRHK